MFMTEPTKLQRKKLESIPKEELKWYIVNEQEGRAIKIPKKVQNAIDKLWTNDFENREKASFISDLLAMSIKYRALSDTPERLEKWENIGSLKPTYYPTTKENLQISKLLEMGFHSKLFVGFFTPQEVEALEMFLFRCPPNYDFSRLIPAHDEFKPIVS